MNNSNDNKCRAWVESTNDRCKKTAQWKSKYCWHHQSKIPIVIAVVISIIAGLIIPKVWEHFLPSPTMKEIEENTDLIPDIAKDIEIIKNELTQKIQTTTNYSNKLVGNLFVTKIQLYSKNVIPNIKVTAYADTIEEFNITAEKAKMIARSYGNVKGSSFINVSNFGGKYYLIIKTKKLEKLRITIAN